MAETKITRRNFLGAAATVLPLQLSWACHGRPRPGLANEKLNIAGIGFGGQGASNLSAVETENIVALCDVDQEYAAKTFAKYPNAKRYVDYREMLEKQKDIDAVIIARPTTPMP